MSSNPIKRTGWLKFMYYYTIMGAGALGLGILLVPNLIQSLLGFPAQDEIVFAIVGSVYTIFGLLSLLGLRSPMKFVPVLLLQLCYKLLWSFVVIAHSFISGRLPAHALLLLVIFATYIIGDLIAIPFPYIFSRETTD